jgi:hypothetical protein
MLSTGKSGPGLTLSLRGPLALTRRHGQTVPKCSSSWARSSVRIRLLPVPSQQRTVCWQNTAALLSRDRDDGGDAVMFSTQDVTIPSAQDLHLPM